MRPRARVWVRSIQGGGHQTLGECYAPDARFSDRVFQSLHVKRVRAMWAMLVRGDNDPDSRSFRDVKADQKSGQVHWEAKYPSPSNPKRQVHNKIVARCEFTPVGRILRQMTASTSKPRQDGSWRARVSPGVLWLLPEQRSGRARMRSWTNLSALGPEFQ